MIKKSSVNSLGAATLQAMNENRFQEGGKSKLSKLRGGQEISLAPAKLGIFKKALLRRSGDKDGDADLDIGGAFLRPSGVINNLRATIKGNEVLSEVVKDIGGTQPQVKKILQNSGMRSGEFSIPINIQSGSFTESQEVDFRSNFKKFANDFGADFNKRVTKLPYSSAKFDSAYNASNKEQIEGGIFESFLNAISIILSSSVDTIISSTYGQSLAYLIACSTNVRPLIVCKFFFGNLLESPLAGIITNTFKSFIVFSPNIIVLVFLIISLYDDHSFS